MINSSFTKANANKAGIKTAMPNRTYLNHMMYWRAEEYNPFEAEIVGHMKKNDGWFEKFCKQQLKKCEHLYGQGLRLKKIDWSKKSNKQIADILEKLFQEYRELTCPWYTQYPLDEYFEKAIEQKLSKYINENDPNYRKYVLVFSDPKEMTEVAQERWQLTKLAKEFFAKKENLDKLSPTAQAKIYQHLDKFAYINRGLATSKPYSYLDIVNRLIGIKQQLGEGKKIDGLIYDASSKKIGDEYAWALKQVKPRADFKKLINQARFNSYFRNRRVEAFFNADYGASFAYAEVAKRNNFNPNWIMEISIPEMMSALKEGKPLPDEKEMRTRLKNYAMLVRNSQTELITDPKRIKELEKEYSVEVDKAEEIQGRMACLGGLIRGKAKICLDKSAIGKVKQGDILVVQFTTPDFVPAMEKAAAIVADQGGLSSHAAIVSRELGVPCVIATKNGTRVIKENDLLEINAQTGIVKIIKRTNK